MAGELLLRNPGVCGQVYTQLLHAI